MDMMATREMMEMCGADGDDRLYWEMMGAAGDDGCVILTLYLRATRLFDDRHGMFSFLTRSLIFISST